MKRLLFLTSLSLPLFGGSWHTAPSITAGAKYLSYFPSSMDTRIEQYFIHEDQHKYYYKAGYFHEQLKAWDTEVDTSHDLQLGAGINLFSFGDAFIDAGLSAAYRFAYNAQQTDSVKVVYSDSPIVPFAEVGLGYSFGDFTLRADFLLGLMISGKAELLASDDTLIASYSYSQYHMNMGLLYWW